MNQISAGMLRRRVDAGGFVVTESEYAPAAATAPHAHSLTSLVFGLAGSLEQTHGSRTGTMLPRRTLILPRDAVHAERVSPYGCRCLFVTLSEQHLERLDERADALLTPRCTVAAPPAAGPPCTVAAPAPRATPGRIRGAAADHRARVRRRRAPHLSRPHFP